MHRQTFFHWLCWVSQRCWAFREWSAVLKLWTNFSSNDEIDRVWRYLGHYRLRFKLWKLCWLVPEAASDAVAKWERRSDRAWHLLLNNSGHCRWKKEQWSHSYVNACVQVPAWSLGRHWCIRSVESAHSLHNLLLVENGIGIEHQEFYGSPV